MTTEIILKTEDKALLDAIENTGKIWYEMDLPEHEIYPQFARKLVVTGFNTPDLEIENEDRIYVYVRQYLYLKESNILHKKVKMPDWFIHEGNAEEVVGQNGIIMGTEIVKDDEGIVVSEKAVMVKANSVKYVRFLVKNKQAYIGDILEQFMALYVQLFKNEIDNI